MGVSGVCLLTFELQTMNIPTHGTSANIRDFHSSVCTGVVQGENTEILFRLLSVSPFYFGRSEFRPLSKDRLQSCGLVFRALSLSLSPLKQSLLKRLQIGHVSCFQIITHFILYIYLLSFDINIICQQIDKERMNQIRR